MIRRLIVCNIVEYTTAFLYSYWLVMKCGITVLKSQLVLFRNVITACFKFYLRTILVLNRQRHGFTVFPTPLFVFVRAFGIVLLESLD